ncbi:LysE family transporter [Aureibaculum sp. 2210JD6-5]|uniref:LysE family translocator n=1 Tax=Aureibaculum sp. 2210JD6-5 TaxID=3103957 RepID=UPI002AAEBE02|nr:LysE family transporter [Aureibaculum sp. 2210JD6-5]MDY7393756.1 LysE family transporter [Aureibaculum sp. 2210JD6-5]
MNLISHLFLGFISAFIGLLGPGMLNMTAVRTTIEQGKKAGVVFSLGAISVVLVQASMALFFANFIIKNPKILDNLRVAAIIVFFMLAVFFFIQARKKSVVKGKIKKGNLFVIGVVMSSLNMLAIPFYFGVSTYFKVNGQLNMELPYIFLFVIGSVLGSFSVFLLYIYFAGIINQKAKFIATNINYILSGLFIALGIIAFLKS